MSAASTSASISSNFQKFLENVRRLPGARPSADFARPDYVTGVVFVAVLIGVCGVALREYIAPDYRAEIVPMLTGLDTGGLQGALDALPGYPAAALIELIVAKVALIFGASEGGVWRSSSAFSVAMLAYAVYTFLPLVKGTEATRTAKRVGICLALGSPAAYWALRIGHPEEVFSTAFLLIAIIAAAKEKPVMAGIFLGLACGKAWPIAAAFPVLGLLLPDWRRVLLGTVAAGVVVVAFYAPAFLFAHNSVETLSNLGTHTIFNVGQVFWWFGTPIPEATVMLQQVPQPRVAPVWVGQVSHPLIVGVGFAVGLVWCWTVWERLTGSRSVALLRNDGRTRSTEEMAQLAAAALLVCAGILYARCFLDTWNVPYYILPALIFGALGEVLLGRVPMLSLVATGIMWKWCTPADPTVRTDPDIYNALFVAWSVPFGIWFMVQGFKAIKRVQSVVDRAAGRDADDDDATAAEAKVDGAAQPA